MAGDNLAEGVVISGGTLQTPNGQVNIVSIGASQLPGIQRVSVDIDTLNIQGLDSQGEVVQDSARLGDIMLSQGAQIDTSGYSGGLVLIRGGQFVMEEDTKNFDPLVESGAAVDWGLAMPVVHDGGDAFSHVEWISFVGWDGADQFMSAFMASRQAMAPEEQEAWTLSHRRPPSDAGCQDLRSQVPRRHPP